MPLSTRSRPDSARSGSSSPVDERYTLERGTVQLTAVQALVRGIFDQRRADRRAGRRTAAFVSGYQGSPLAGFDKELARQGRLAAEYEVTHQPGLNEELGATAVFGSQLASNLDAARYEGVVGYWYGKAPGLDRATDAFRHGNYAGVTSRGGVVAMVGDDPSCKSSTLPSASEATLAALNLPTLYPGNVQEVIDFALHAVALSRASGCWSALKMVTSVADGFGTAVVDPKRVEPRAPEVAWAGAIYQPEAEGMLLAPRSLELEQTLFGVRLPAAMEYARLNDLNRIPVSSADDWLGIIAAGKTYFELRQALVDLGYGDDRLRRSGVRLLKVGLIYPLEPDVVRRFASGLEEVLVVEEKSPFLEAQVKSCLYGSARPPQVTGKRTLDGHVLVPQEGELDPALIERAVAARMRQRIDDPRLERAPIEVVRRATAGNQAKLARTPFFCSGCPHNLSTVAPDGALVGAGIGCHTMILLAPEGRGQITGVTQMGGEGMQWAGMAPFVETDHFTQNIGDGTLHHSGSLAIRAAVAAGIRVTFKVLYNDHVAMTGGQAVEGAIPVPELTRLLELEGVSRTIVTTNDKGRYRGAALARNAEVRDRGEIVAAQRELAQMHGVTALIHDQQCAAELRRARKRGKAPEPATRVVINERVCEGCGDCGRKSNCLSVVPIQTEFGRKTQIHQASCNKDYSCLEGDCPSFLTVTSATPTADREVPPPPSDMRQPTVAEDGGDFTVRMVGVGGTGVVTISQVLGMAAMLEGAHVWGLDQTGLSQKGGPVVSDLRISRDPTQLSNKPSAGQVDLYLAFDLLGAVDSQNLSAASAANTVAVVSTSAVPTGAMIIDPNVRFPELDQQLKLIEGSTRRGENFYLDAQSLSEQLFGDHVHANAIALGAAYQRGALPVRLGSLESAFEINGAAVDRNLAALAWGRACVASPDAVEALVSPEPAQGPRLSDFEAGLIERIGGPARLRRLLEFRIPDLVGYQSRAWAAEYAEFVEAVAQRTVEWGGDGERITEAVARSLHKLMTYKDEYEVARLHLDPTERARVRREFGPDARVFINLHPPILRAIGLKRKLRLGRWFTPFLYLLRGMRRFRGRRLDPFGWMKLRRVERGLVAEYRDLVARALYRLDERNVEAVLKLCELPEIIRGYEGIKLRNVDRFRTESEALVATLCAPRA